MRTRKKNAMQQRKKCQGIQIIKGTNRQQRIAHFHFGNAIFGVFAALFKRLALKKINTPNLCVHPNRSANFKAAPSILLPIEGGRTERECQTGQTLVLNGPTERLRKPAAPQPGRRRPGELRAAGGSDTGGPAGRGGGAGVLLCCSLIGRAWAEGSEEQEGSRGTDLRNTQN